MSEQHGRGSTVAVGSMPRGATRIGALAAITAIVTLGCRSDPRSSERVEPVTTAATDVAESIGTATMESDGTIVLLLRAEVPSGATGEARMTYAPTHKEYANVLQHLGGLRRGETKPVPRWPDEP